MKLNQEKLGTVLFGYFAVLVSICVSTTAGQLSTDPSTTKIQTTPTATACFYWTVLPNTAVLYGEQEHQPSYTTLAQCQAYCISRPNCVSIDFENTTGSDSSGCWVNTNPNEFLYDGDFVTHYILNRACDSTTTSYNYSLSTVLTNAPFSWTSGNIENTPTNKPVSNNSLIIGLAVGLGVGFIVVAALIIISVFCIRRRNTKKKVNKRTAINMAAVQGNPNESEVPYNNSGKYESIHSISDMHNYLDFDSNLINTNGYNSIQNSRPRSIQTYLSIDDSNTNSLQYNRIEDHYGTSVQGYQTVDTRSRNSHKYATALPTAVASASGWYLHVISTAQANGLPYYNSADSSESANRSQNPSIYRSMSHERVRPSDGASELSNGASQRSGRATQRSGGASQRSGGASQRSGRASVRSNLFLDSSTLYQTIDSKLKAPSVEIVDQE